MNTQPTPGMSPIVVILIVLLSIASYWLPAIVAWVRHVPNAGSVTVINGFLGWTVVGWIVALAMACRSRTVPVSVNQVSHKS
jgi:hypothetical protein